MIHYFLIFLIIAGIVIWQIHLFSDTVNKSHFFKKIFPVGEDALGLDFSENGELYISTNTSEYNSAFNVIIRSINNYLCHNEGAVSDFHLIKDIVERNCDAKEEEINTQIPIPLYLGLVGTMMGILVGVGYLAFSGGLEALLSAEIPQHFKNSFQPDVKNEIIEKAWALKGSEGVITLLGGVAVAMTASIVGILLTTFGSVIAKNVKVVVEENKNTFLSWIQANLLPELSDGVAAIMEKLTRNLNHFNNTFAKNTQEFQTAISSVTATYRDLSNILDALNSMKINEIGKIASYNVSIYKELKNCTDEIGYFSTYLHNVNEYITNVRALNEKLDKNENRTRTFEDIGKFFRDEVQQIEYRKKYISQAVDNTDTVLQKAFDDLQINTQRSIGKIDAALQKIFEDLRENTQKSVDDFNFAAGKQQEALQQKLEETEKIVDELHRFPAVVESMSKMEKATIEQTNKFNRLAQAIEQLAQMRLSRDGTPTVTPIASMPRWAKILLITSSSLVSAVCLTYLIPLIWNLLSSSYSRFFY